VNDDYHGQLDNSSNFEKWLKEKLIPIIPGNKKEGITFDVTGRIIT
jgi:hypothetical protein